MIDDEETTGGDDMRLFFLIFAAVMSIASVSAPQDVVYIVRHAEKELSGDDPSITVDGQARAAAWAEMLQHVGLDVIITSDAKRTLQTGQIIAERLGLPVNSVNRSDTAGLVDVLSFDHEEDTVLVIGHAETIPSILGNFGISNDIAISQSDFGNLYILVGPGADDPRLIHLRMP